MRNLKMYILINSDLDYSSISMYEKMLGQVGHAVGVYERELRKRDINLYEEYYIGNIKKIILYAPQSKLEELESCGYTAIRDAGFTILEPGTLTVVNVGILDGDNLPIEYKWLKKYRTTKKQ